MKRLPSIIFAFIISLCLQAQVSRLAENVQYFFSAEGTAGTGDNAPFWFTNNKYGLGTTQNFSGLARTALYRTAETDSLWFWRYGYGIDLASPINDENGYFKFLYEVMRPFANPIRRGASKYTGTLLSSSVTQMIISASPLNTSPSSSFAPNFMVLTSPMPFTFIFSLP